MDRGFLERVFAGTVGEGFVEDLESEGAFVGDFDGADADFVVVGFVAGVGEPFPRGWDGRVVE